MSREESLGKRLLNYLGLGFWTIRSVGKSTFIQIDFSNTDAFVVPDFYDTWRTVLYGNPRYNFENLCEYIILNSRLGIRFKTKNPPFEYSSLDELELQLSARGF